MESILNIDLLWVGIAVAGAGTLGGSIYFSDRASATSRTFVLFTIASICWSIATFFSARATEPAAALWLIRLVLFFASWHALSFLLLAYQFPASQSRLPRRSFLALLIWTAVISIVALTPSTYEAIVAVAPTVQTKTGPGIALFGLTILAYIGAGLYQLGRKFFRSFGTERHQMEFVLTGMSLTFVLLVAFEFIFPAFLNDPNLVPYGGLFLMPFIAGTAYAILRYRLFKLRVAIFGLLTFSLATATFFDILFSDSLLLVLYRLAELGIVLFSGVWLLRSMVREFELERELEETNERQESLIHFVSHEVKGFLARYMGAFAGYVEGDYGALPAPALEMAQRMLPQTREDARMVTDILQASNLKKGTITFKKEPFDLKALVEKRFAALKPAAEAKGLAMSLAVDAAGAPYMMLGDEAQFGDHVLQNLIQNSINYTPSGSIAVSLGRENGRILFAVKDTGVGITDEDKKRLFTEGGHGKDSVKVNAHSTGYGLYIAKEVVDAHGGTIRAESEGAGKGSRFVVELPAQA
jgi:signal transduction histidine kinase